MSPDRSCPRSEVRPRQGRGQVARRGAALTWVTLGVASALAAQAPESAPTGTIRGVVRGEMSRLLADAEIFLGSDSAGIRNTVSGTFRFTQVAEGQYWLFVRRIGYAPTRRLLSVSGGQELAVEVRLEPLPFNLPDIEVEARSGYRDFDEFRQHTRNAWGRSVSEAQIRDLGEMKLSALVAPRLPFQATSWFAQARREIIALTDYSGAPISAGRYGPPVVPMGPLGIGGYPTVGWFGVAYPLTGSDRPPRRPLWGGVYPAGTSLLTGDTWAWARSPLGTGCAPAVSLNGKRPSVGVNLDDIDPDLVSSMEIYEPKQRGGQVPADFADDAWVAGCGLVVVWSR